MAGTREIIERYYDGWLRSDRDLVRALLADDVVFRSPDDEFQDADSFLAKCWKLSEGFTAMNVAHAVFDEDAGYLVYTFGNFAIGELVRVRGGRISEIYVTYNPTH